MSEEIFLLPDVGGGLVEAEIVTWKVKVGDVVVLNQPLVDIETAKATVELPSPYAGTVVALHGNVGDVMEVHKPLITFDVGGAAGPSAAAAPGSPTSRGGPVVAPVNCWLLPSNRARASAKVTQRSGERSSSGMIASGFAVAKR